MQVTGVIGVGQDITTIRGMTSEYERVAKDLQRLIETANAPIFAATPRPALEYLSWLQHMRAIFSAWFNDDSEGPSGPEGPSEPLAVSVT